MYSAILVATYRLLRTTPLVLVGVWLSFGCSKPAQDVAEPRLAGEIQTALDQILLTLDLPGITAAVVLPDGTELGFASGYEDRERGIAMQPESRLMSGSVGKTFVAATVLSLANDGILALDDPLARWLGDQDWFSRLPNAADISLRMLLNHSSGMPDHMSDALFGQTVTTALSGPNPNPDLYFTPPELVAFVLDDPPLFPAGSSYGYSDTGYILLGMVIEQVAQRDFYTVVRERFLIPLDLSLTGPADRRHLPGLSAGYIGPENPFGLGGRKAAEDGIMIFNPANEWTGGGFVTNSRDLARWAWALYTGRAIDGAYLEDLLTGVPRDTTGAARYGLGVFIDETPRGLRYGHAGWMFGYLSRMDYYPDHHFAIAVQFNSDAGDRFAVRDAVINPLADIVIRHLDTLS